MYRKLLAIAAICFAMTGATARAQFLDLRLDGSTASGTAAIGGTFILSQTDIQSTGTGVLQPFLTVQQPNGRIQQELGFNTSLSLPLDTKRGGGGFTEAVRLGDLQAVTIAGQTGTFFQFLVDVNQEANEEVSLNQFQLFVSDEDLGGSGGFTLAGASATTNALIAFNDATEVFRLNNLSTSPTTFEIAINTGNGSGSGDAFFFVNTSLFSSFSPDSFLTLFTQFGIEPGQFQTNAGFEEISVLTVSNVPEPASIVMSLSGALLPLGLWASHRRKRATA